MLIVAATTVMLPGGVLLGARVFKSVSINSKSLGEAAQVRLLLAPGALLTRVRFRLKSMPLPLNGVMPSFEKAETRSVLIWPLPKILPATFQLVPVSPTAATGGFWKLMTAESKVKSP